MDRRTPPAERYPASPREFVGGERLLVPQGGSTDCACGLWVLRAPCDWKARYFQVPVGYGLKGDDRAGAVREALVDWYRAHVDPKLGERVALWCRKLGVEEPKVIITSQQRRWASCWVAGIIRINWRVVQAPVSLLDYVIGHELAHLRHHEHLRAFWRTLGAAMPNRREPERNASGRGVAVRVVTSCSAQRRIVMTFREDVVGQLDHCQITRLPSP